MAPAYDGLQPSPEPFSDPFPESSLSSRLSTLPVDVRGSSSTNSTSRGTLYPARFCLTCRLSSSSVSEAPSQHHDRLQPLPELLVVDAEHGRLGDRLVARQQILDLGREHVLAAGHDHVVVAAVDEQAAVLVEVPDVAGREQPVDLVLAAAARVALELHLVADEDAPGLAGRNRVAVVVVELDDRAVRRAGR